MALLRESEDRMVESRIEALVVGPERSEGRVLDRSMGWMNVGADKVGVGMMRD